MKQFLGIGGSDYSTTTTAIYEVKYVIILTDQMQTNNALSQTF